MSKNNEILKDFAKYCEENPEQRFWQALRNWSGYQYIYASNDYPPKLSKWIKLTTRTKDTFYWEGKNK